MRNKNKLNSKKTKTAESIDQYNNCCKHCGGAFKIYQDETTCVMCGRDSKHFCDNCLKDSHLIRKSA